ncbi:Relaxase/Mobilisation nuclease domain-containing protein [Ruminococcus flavefaciens]|uniref:Relaxase/Mobilisation nuclease domain-containing protein n=1 Tax=Ruminococcus flavefaciens TaxID=1265 RepID=A0A1H6LJE0_RUMFL|nr:relaxase/mobilization nuclease domain-containing protein [Ruminococcus flavefaciens]SEH86382.1 Relaxase/Mobilisation nuclease domain-containing protein [Ruminococcus flavefaciens]
MDKDYDILKVIWHADGGDEYSTNATKYPSNEDCVGLRGYGVDADDPATAKMQFDSLSKYHGNEGKNEFIQFMISPLKETAPDAETAMEIADQVLDPLKDEYLILIGAHKKEHQKSDYHTHGYVGTTNLETGKMLHPTNKLNYAMAQRMADTIQKPVELVIERKNKSPEPDSSQNGGNNTEKKKDFTRIFYPHKNTND